MKRPKRKAPGIAAPGANMQTNRGHDTPPLHRDATRYPEPFRSIVARVVEGDRRYFAEHPEAQAFTRRYVPGEAYPELHPGPGTVTVYRISPRTSARAFTFPDGPSAN